MNFKDLEKQILTKAEQLKKAAETEIPLLVESEALLFVDNNFRNQGWEGVGWQKNDRDGTILVDSSTLRRGFESTANKDEVKITNEVKYAAPHNEGFEGEVTVKEFTRSNFKKKGAKKKKIGSGKVKSHKRKMKLPQRQFAPTNDSPSPTLNKNVKQAIETKINSVLKS